ncbi:MAG: transposase, partial [Chloroflexi bacterium]|nr:transposase [Chloroflexota bacterium]
MGQQKREARMTCPPKTRPGAKWENAWTEREAAMPRKRFAAEEIINKLREAEVRLARGETVAQVCKVLGVTDQTFYRWRREYGGLRIDQAKRL